LFAHTMQCLKSLVNLASEALVQCGSLIQLNFSLP
jgi:hypothetical protein